MMKRLFIAMGVVLAVSCSSKEDIPNDVLKQPQMQAVLWDMLRADEFVTNYVKNDSLHKMKDESIRLYEDIFLLHKTNKKQFVRSIMFYNGHPELLKPVLDSLESRKNTIMQDVHRTIRTDTSHKTVRGKDSSHLLFRQADSARRRLKMMKPQPAH